jgi:superfamily I DNA/RNA helicase
MLQKNPDLSVCVAVFTHALKDLIRTGFEESFRNKVSVVTYHQFLNDKKRFDLVIVDEVQDIPHYQLKRIKGLAGRMVVAGDTDQSIYEKSSSMEEINEILKPRPHRLVVLYRLTQKLRNIVQSILPNSQIEAARTGRMQDVQVALANADSERKEIEWVWYSCCRYSMPGDPSAVLLPNHNDVKKFVRTICEIEGISPPSFPSTANGSTKDYQPANQQLELNNIPLQYLGNSFGDLIDSDSKPLTYIMTYHSAKGLDFDTVFLPFLNENQMFWRDNDDIDRRVFFVGATRSRRNLFLSYSSATPHKYVNSMPQNLLHKVKCEVKKTTVSADNEFYF